MCGRHMCKRCAPVRCCNLQVACSRWQLVTHHPALPVLHVVHLVKHHPRYLPAGTAAVRTVQGKGLNRNADKMTTLSGCDAKALHKPNMHMTLCTAVNRRRPIA
jgi:hypothetical protein